MNCKPKKGVSTHAGTIKGKFNGERCERIIVIAVYRYAHRWAELQTGLRIFIK